MKCNNINRNNFERTYNENVNLKKMLAVTCA